MNLIEYKWLPVRRANGGRELIAPWQLTDQHDGPNRLIALDSPRPDFNGALTQFLVGLLQVAVAPETDDDSDWLEWLETPPTPEQLRDKFRLYSKVFNLDGDGPRFMQDFDAFEAKEPEPISALLIDSPGANTLKNNADHFVKRGRVNAMCPGCAAMALYALQTNAPSGGAGHRTSMRGGGPLTTLVVLDPVGEKLDESLWRNLWLNIINKQYYTALTGNLKKNELADIFPWMAATRTSDKNGRGTFPQDVHPLQMYWGMPRRIRLDWENAYSGECDICGNRSDRLVQNYVTKNYGVSYDGAWQHPLSPHRIDDKTGEPLPKHPQPGGFSYRHWLAWVADRDSEQAAFVVSGYVNSRRKLDNVPLRLSVFGYDMDNMKARCWYEATFPLVLVPKPYRVQFSERVETLIGTASEAAGFVRSCVKDAWFSRPGDAKGDTSFLIESFFIHTQQSFLQVLHQLERDLKNGSNGISVLTDWHSVLRVEAISLFDHWTGCGNIEYSNPKRIADAHEKLLKLLYAKKYRGLLHVPDKKEKAA